MLPLSVLLQPSGVTANFSWCGRAGSVVPFLNTVRARRTARRYGSYMKAAASLIYVVALAGSQIASALEFSGAKLTEQEIYGLWGKNNCKSFMVNSTSSKSAMPKVLADYLNSDASYQEVKIITCKYKTVDIWFYLTQKKSGWAMFSGEAVAIPSRNSP